MAHHVKNPERFHLRLHRELKEQAPYALVIGKNGARLKFSEDQSDEEATRSVGFGGFGLDATRKSLGDLAGILMAWTDRPVVYMTALPGFTTSG